MHMHGYLARLSESGDPQVFHQSSSESSLSSVCSEPLSSYSNPRSSKPPVYTAPPEVAFANPHPLWKQYKPGSTPCFDNFHPKEVRGSPSQRSSDATQAPSNFLMEGHPNLLGAHILEVGGTVPLGSILGIPQQPHPVSGAHTHASLCS